MSDIAIDQDKIVDGSDDTMTRMDIERRRLGYMIFAMVSLLAALGCIVSGIQIKMAAQNSATLTHEAAVIDTAKAAAVEARRAAVAARFAAEQTKLINAHISQSQDSILSYVRTRAQASREFMQQLKTIAMMTQVKVDSVQSSMPKSARKR